jgi:hypothetical protein
VTVPTRSTPWPAADPDRRAVPHLFYVHDPRADRVQPPLNRPVVAKRGVNVVVKAKGPQIDRTTGFIGEDNSGKGNIFAIEPRQLYTESPTSDKYAKQGLGGIPGALLALGIVAVVVFATQNLGSFEEKNNEFANFQGKPLTYYIETFSK